VQERHGRRGHVNLTTSVPPALKDHLVELAEHRGSTLKAEIEAALRSWIYGVETDRERWYGG
jgi:predicted transcriptional regulator